MEKGLSPKDTALLIHIEHSKPIELQDFTQSLKAVGNLYSSYAKKYGGMADYSNAKLYVNKIEEGSIDIYLCEQISSALIPFIENANTILDFAGYVKNVVEYFTIGKGEKPFLTPSENRNLRNVFGITAKDRNGITSIGAVKKNNHTNIYNNCTFNFNGSNSAQNQLREMEEDAEPAEPAEIQRRQLMTIFQMRGDMASDKGNKAIVESISNRKVALVFETDELKSRILGMDGNPTKKAFLVDLVVMYANERIAAYKVTALHEVVDIS